jgi:outer membrane protein assembly factor BamA
VIAALMLALAIQVPEVQTAPPAPQTQQTSPPREVIAEVRVHGNQIVTDEEVLKLSGVVVGVPFSDAVLAEAAKRLKDSGKFESIDVLKRFASIEDASRIIVVIIVNEGSVRIVTPATGGTPQVKKRTVLSNLMFVPVLEGQDGYGLTYGARIAYPKPFGSKSRLSFPMTWGGTKRIGIELDRTFTQGPISRMEVGTTLQRRRNPAYDEQDDRGKFWVRAQKSIWMVRAGVIGTFQEVSFGALNDQFSSIGADVTLDTRADPVLPRNAVLVMASAERIFMVGGPPITRARIEANGYIGLFRQHVLIVRGVVEDANRTQPLYMRSIMGGWSTVRGYETGFLTGDTMAVASLEWRTPIPTPLRFGKLGVSAFADWGTAYDDGLAFKDQTIYRGLGGTVWFSVASFRIGMAVGYGRGAGTHVHFSGGIGF